MKKVLVVAAHPDDEVLGVGGTIKIHTNRGDDVHVIIIAEGLTSRSEQRELFSNTQDLFGLHDSSQKVREILGVSHLEHYSLPDNRLDQLDLLDVIKPIEKKINQFCPDIVYTHFPNDLNIDHKITAQAVITATRMIPGQSVKELYFFETPSSTEWQIDFNQGIFVPQYFMNIEKTLNDKLIALKSYETEMRPFPHPRSYEAVEFLAKWRGATAGVMAAEAFMVGRIIGG